MISGSVAEVHMVGRSKGQLVPLCLAQGMILADKPNRRPARELRCGPCRKYALAEEFEYHGPSFEQDERAAWLFVYTN